MTTRKHCKFLRMITTRISRDEHRRIKQAAKDEGLALNTWARRKLGLADAAVEDDFYIPSESTVEQLRSTVPSKEQVKDDRSTDAAGEPHAGADHAGERA